MRAVIGLVLFSGCAADPPPHGSSGSPTVSTADPAHVLTWAPDGGPAVELGVREPHYRVVAGDCAPDVVVLARPFDRDGGLELYFSGDPDVGTRAPLSLADMPAIAPLVVVTFEPYRFEDYYGGEVEVLRFDRGGWTFRLGGDTFEQCVDGDVCAPHPGGTVTIAPVSGDSDGLGTAWEDGCYSGVSYTWPDGWQACRIESGEATCPETLPW